MEKVDDVRYVSVDLPPITLAEGVVVEFDKLEEMTPAEIMAAILADANKIKVQESLTALDYWKEGRRIAFLTDRERTLAEANPNPKAFTVEKWRKAHFGGISRSHCYNFRHVYGTSPTDPKPLMDLSPTDALAVGRLVRGGATLADAVESVRNPETKKALNEAKKRLKEEANAFRTAADRLLDDQKKRFQLVKNEAVVKDWEVFRERDKPYEEAVQDALRLIQLGQRRGKMEEVKAGFDKVHEATAARDALRQEMFPHVDVTLPEDTGTTEESDPEVAQTIADAPEAEIKPGRGNTYRATFTSPKPLPPTARVVVVPGTTITVTYPDGRSARVQLAGPSSPGLLFASAE